MWKSGLKTGGRYAIFPIFCLTVTVRKKVKKNGSTELFSYITEAMHAELNERAEAVLSSYSAAVDFWYYIYSVLVTKNH